MAHTADDSKLRALAFGAVYLLWGGSYLAIRFVVQAVPPFLAAGVRYSLSALILISVSLLVRKSARPSPQQLLNCCVTGVVMFVLGYSAIYWAETRLASWLVAVLTSSGYLWTALLEPIMLGSARVRVAAILPVLGGLGGMLLLVTSPLKVGHPGSRIAAAAVVASVIAWSCMTILLKRINLPSCYMQTAGLQLAGAGAALLLLSCGLGEWHRLPETHRLFQAGPVLGMTYLVVGGSVIAFTIFHWLLRRETASMVSTTTYINPIVAMLAGIVLFHERYSGRQLVGAAAVLLCVVLAWRSKGTVRPRAIQIVGKSAASRSECTTGS